MIVSIEGTSNMKAEEKIGGKVNCPAFVDDKKFDEAVARMTEEHNARAKMIFDTGLSWKLGLIITNSIGEPMGVWAKDEFWPMAWVEKKNA